MKMFSDAKPLKRSEAMNCLLVNQLATPGLGSLMGRRLLPGVVQLSLALVGFSFFIGYFVRLCYRLINDLPEEADLYPWLGKAGWLIFGSAWLLSWFTSISLLRHSVPDTVAEPLPSVPPRPLPPKIKKPYD